MTDKEKAVVMAYTGIAMLTGDKFEIFHKYVEEIMNRPVFTHELATYAEEIKERAKFDFLALCAEEELPDATFELHRDDMFSGGCYLQCTRCKWKFSGGAYKILEHDNYCPHCGAKIKRPEEPDGITLTFNVDKIEKFEDASCENCEHAYQAADPLNIFGNPKYPFSCAAGHAYGGAETVCSEWKRKEGEQDDDE